MRIRLLTSRQYRSLYNLTRSQFEHMLKREYITVYKTTPKKLWLVRREDDPFYSKGKQPRKH